MTKVIVEVKDDMIVGIHSTEPVEILVVTRNTFDADADEIMPDKELEDFVNGGGFSPTEWTSGVSDTDLVRLFDIERIKCPNILK